MTCLLRYSCRSYYFRPAGGLRLNVTQSSYFFALATIFSTSASSFFAS